MANKKLNEFTEETTIANDDYVYISDTSNSNATRKMTRVNLLNGYVDTSTAQTVTNKTFTDNVTTIQDNSDNTKKFQFQASSITAGQTRTVTVPDSDLTLVGLDTAQTLTNKTLTNPTIQGTFDGWVAANETWTYASASTFTVSGDQTSKYVHGLKLKFTQTTVKYAVVKSSSHGGGTTTVTIYINTDYTLANAAITSPYYSTDENPIGFPDLFNYVPTYTGSGSLTYSTVTTTSAKYAIRGRLCHMFIYVIGTTGGTTSSEVRVSTPSGIACTGYATTVGNQADAGFFQALCQITNTDTFVRCYRDASFNNWGLGSDREVKFSITFPV